MYDMAAEIKQALTAREVFEQYGFRPNQAGFIQCPFHEGDHHGSLKVYDGPRGWHCFGCGAGGSVIDFAMRLFDLNFKDACLRLNEDFHLGLSDQKPSKAELSKLAEMRRQKERKAAEAEARYRRVAREHLYWMECKKFFAPIGDSAASELHPLYAEAIKRLPALEYWLDQNIGMGR